MVNTRNNSLSKDKILSALCLIIFVLLFIFSCLSKSISFGAKIVGTFGALCYPVFLMVSFICLIKFLGFSYKRNVKATVLFLCFLYFLLAIIHCIRTYSILDAVASATTFKAYLNYSYSNLTLLGSLGSVICGSVSYLLGGVGAIVVFVILSTLFIGFFIDFELYGKYSEKHIKKLKTRKMREKVFNANSNISENGKPVYSFTNDVDKYSNEDVVASISANLNDNSDSNGYSQGDIVGEISDGKVYDYDNRLKNVNFNNFDNSMQSNQKNFNQSSENMFGDDAVTSNAVSSSQTLYTKPTYPDVYDENEQRRRFLNATYNSGLNDNFNDSYSSLLSNYQSEASQNDNYNSSNNSNLENNQVDSYESFTNHYYGGNSFEDSTSSNNSSDYDNYESSYSNFDSATNFSFPDYTPPEKNSSGLDFLNDEISNNNASTDTGYGQYDYENLYKNYNDSDPYSFKSNTENEKQSFNVDDQISKILNKDESLDDSYQDVNPFTSSTDDISNIIKEDISNNYLNENKNTSFDNKNSFDNIGLIENKNIDKNIDNLKTQSQENSKMKIPAKESQVKKYSGFNLGMSGLKYNPPKIELLNPPVKDEGNYDEEQSRKAKGLETALKAFNIPVTVVNIVRGPKITRYELSVPLGVSIKKIPNYELDIKKTLAAKTVNIQAPIPGSEYVGIELENDTFTNVSMRELLESDAFKNSNDILPFVVGKDISGEIIVKSLAKMVHMLIAGQTGSGKSVFIHSIIMSLIYKYSPDDLRLVLMDPKRVEFNIYNGLPHLLTPEVVLGTEKSVNALKWCVAEMDRRYELMSKAGYNHITSYNNSELVKSGQLPRFCYIVIVVDEFAEVIMENKKEAEPCIQRLTQLARACGMHLILATQRPSVDVISGVIKNNVPSRVAFSLASSFDSKTIIGTTGAENLLGQGDMLFAPNGTSVIQRLQAAYCTDEEIKKVIDYDIQNNEAHYDESAAAMINEQQKSGEYAGGSDMPPPKELDAYFKIALKMFIQKGDASGSYLQRRLQIGYSRAAKIMDQLEDRGYIASANGGKVRKVLMTAEQFKNEFGEDIDANNSDY